MRGQITLLAFLLLLWKLTAFVNCEPGKSDASKITVADKAEVIKVSCEKGSNLTKPGGIEVGETLEIPYSDEFSGEYTCADGNKIYVKIRTCDNCIELDMVAISGIAVGNLVATVLIGVAVYLIGSNAQAGPVTSNKKIPIVSSGSDRKQLIPNNNSNREPGDTYQPLKRHGPKDEYDVLRR